MISTSVGVGAAAHALPQTHGDVDVRENQAPAVNRIGSPVARARTAWQVPASRSRRPRPEGGPPPAGGRRQACVREASGTLGAGFAGASAWLGGAGFGIKSPAGLAYRGGRISAVVSSQATTAPMRIKKRFMAYPFAELGQRRLVRES